MAVETLGTSRLVQLADGRSVFVRTPTGEDSAALADLAEAPFAYLVCGAQGGSPGCACGPTCEHLEPSMVAALENDGLIAAGWLHCDRDQPLDSKFGLAVLPAFTRAGIVPIILRELAGEAERRGVRRLHSCVGRGTRDPLADCRAGGLPILSSISFGGVTEIVLGVSAGG